MLARLDRFVRENPGTSSSSVANMFIDESLRTYEHPGVVFRPGPTGRRAALDGGPDVWEVVTALQALRDEDINLGGEALLEELARVTGLSREQVGTAVRYYAAYPDEVDDRVAANVEAADRQEQLWLAERRLLERRAS